MADEENMIYDNDIDNIMDREIGEYNELNNELDDDEMDEETKEELHNELIYTTVRQVYFDIKQYINDNLLNIGEYLSINDLYDFLEIYCEFV